jgi:transcriptional regulator with XRE-family HTH domain
VLRNAKSAKAIGVIIREARERAGLTQQQLAASAGMDRSYLSDVERGAVSVSLERFLRIAKGIGIGAGNLAGKVEKEI